MQSTLYLSHAWHLLIPLKWGDWRLLRGLRAGNLCYQIKGLFFSMFSALFRIVRRKFLTPMVGTGCPYRCTSGNNAQSLSSARVRAKPHVLAASEIRLACSGDVMATSKAAGCHAIKLGKYKSPGLELSSGRCFCSRTGEGKISRRTSCHYCVSYSFMTEIISPRPCHETAWSPNMSKLADLQYGHLLFESEWNCLTVF